jgi:hypothetical protein
MSKQMSAKERMAYVRSFKGKPKKRTTKRTKKTVKQVEEPWIGPAMSTKEKVKPKPLPKIPKKDESKSIVVYKKPPQKQRKPTVEDIDEDFELAREPRSHNTFVRSIEFDKKKYSPRQARLWLDRHGWTPIKKAHSTEHYLHYRISEIVHTDDIFTTAVGDGINAVSQKL